MNRTKRLRVYVVTAKDRPNLLLRYADPLTGKTKHRSAGTNNRAAAKEKAKAWEDILNDPTKASPGLHKSAEQILPAIACGLDELVSRWWCERFTCQRVGINGDTHLSLPAKPAVYWCEDGHRVLYVGKAQRLRRRWRNHHRQTELEQAAARLSWIELPPWSLSAIEEAIAAYAAPPMNIHNPTAFGDMAYQAADNRAAVRYQRRMAARGSNR